MQEIPEPMYVVVRHGNSRSAARYTPDQLLEKDVPYAMQAIEKSLEVGGDLAEIMHGERIFAAYAQRFGDNPYHYFLGIAERDIEKRPQAMNF